MSPIFDVAIVGGGPAGCAAATILARGGACVALIERERTPTLRPGETLPGSVRRPLMRLGAWTAFECAGHLPSAGARSAWGGNAPAERHGIFSPWGGGWHIDRQRFAADLLAGAQEAGAGLLAGTPLTGLSGLSGRPGAWLLHSEPAVAARFLVDATGRRRAIARRLGARTVREDRLIGVVGWLSGRTSRELRLLVESTECGWWSAAPLPGDRWAVALMSDATLVAARRLATASAWRAALDRTRLIRPAVADARLDGPLRVADAAPSCSEPRAGPGWAAIGEAAQALDPLSGQGIMRALEDGIRLADVLLANDPAPGGLDRTHEHRRAAYYAIERRFPDAPFWRQRAQNGTTLPSQA